MAALLRGPALPLSPPGTGLRCPCPWALRLPEGRTGSGLAQSHLGSGWKGARGAASPAWQRCAAHPNVPDATSSCAAGLGNSHAPTKKPQPKARRTKKASPDRDYCHRQHSVNHHLGKKPQQTRSRHIINSSIKNKPPKKPTQNQT